MRVAAIFACAITVVFGDLIEIDISIELNDLGCPLDATIQKILPHKYCNMFNQCSNGDIKEHRCPGNLLFNIETLQCEWSYNVDCGGRNISESIPEQNESTESETEADDGTCNCDPAEAPEICAQSGSDGVLVAHEYCNKFYKCSGGQPVALRCPRTLCFNPYKKRCDWAENVDCGNKTISEPEDNDNDNTTEDGEKEIDGPINDNPEEAAEICAQDNSDGVLIANEYCNWFFVCHDGNPVAQKCPAGTVYNPRKERCDWPENVDCGNKTISEPEDNGNDSTTEDNGEQEIDGPINDNPEEAATICAQDNSDGILIANEYCNWFFNCHDGIPVAQKCPPNLVYNPRKERCDWPENVDCGNKTISEPEDNGNENTTEDGEKEIDGPINDNPEKAAEICAQDNSDGVLIANEYCNWFFVCHDGNPVAQKCPAGTVYNPRKERCDWPENVDCGNKTISEPEDNGNDSTTEDNGEQEIDGPINDNPEEAATICAQDNSDGILIANEYCNWFFNCHDGIPVAQKCPPNLVYNPRKERCDWPENVDCGNKTISEPEDNGNDNTTEDDSDQETDGPIHDNPAEAAAICAQDNSDGVLIAHENCDEFYICNLYAPVVMRCSSELVYNPRRKQCDWPANVDCGDRVLPERNNTQSEDDESCNNCDPSEAPEICARVGSNGALIAHEYCNQYYKCYAGKPNALRCINTLLFNPAKGWCDWPEQVDCGDRIIPDNEESGNNDPTEASEICARPGSEGVLVAHEVCSKFYKCSHGEPTELECQSGLKYDALMGLCNWPSNVDCGDRQ